MIELLINEYVQLKTYLMFFISFRHYKCSLKNVTPPHVFNIYQLYYSP